MSDTATLAYYKPPFHIHMDFKMIRLVSPNFRYFAYYTIASFIHETMHMFQFFIIAHGKAKYYNTLRYHKMTEHQAYFVSHYLIAKLMGIDSNYNHMLKLAWEDLERSRYLIRAENNV